MTAISCIDANKLISIIDLFRPLTGVEITKNYLVARIELAKYGEVYIKYSTDLRQILLLLDGVHVGYNTPC